jgi:hypothetical protein
MRIALVLKPPRATLAGAKPTLGSLDEGGTHVETAIPQRHTSKN